MKLSLAPAGPVKVTDTDNIPLLKTSERILKLVYLEAKSMKKNTIDTGHLLLAIIKDENSTSFTGYCSITTLIMKKPDGNC